MDYFERMGLLAEQQAPRGLVDRVEQLARPGLDTSRIHPAVVDFFERTADLELMLQPRWSRGFRLLSRLYRAAADLIGQLRVPLAQERVLTRIVALRGEADGRPFARGVLRIYDDGSPMQVLSYAIHRGQGAGYLSVAFPFPWSCLNGVLRLDAIGQDREGRLAVELTSERRPGHDDATGVWLALGPLKIPLPFSETMKLWPLKSCDCPEDIDPDAMPGATLVSRHEQQIFGVTFVRFTYYFRRLPCPSPPAI